MCEFCGCGLYKSVQVILPKEEPLEVAVAPKTPLEGAEAELVLAETEYASFPKECR